MCISSVKMSKKSGSLSLSSEDLSLDQILSLQSLSSQLLAACETSSPRRRRTRRGSRDRRKPESCGTSTASSTSDVASFRWNDLLQKCDPDASLQEVVAAIASKGTGTKARKTSICKYWANSTCANIECNFAHGMAELQYTPGIYKTTICKYWKTRTCTEGDKCRHAHGRKELRPKNFPEHIMRNKLLERMKDDLIRLHKLKQKAEAQETPQSLKIQQSPPNISRAELEALKRLCDSLLQLRSQDNMSHSKYNNDIISSTDVNQNKFYGNNENGDSAVTALLQQYSLPDDMAPNILNNLHTLLRLMQKNSQNSNIPSFEEYCQNSLNNNFNNLFEKNNLSNNNLSNMSNNLSNLSNNLSKNMNISYESHQNFMRNMNQNIQSNFNNNIPSNLNLNPNFAPPLQNNFQNKLEQQIIHPLEQQLIHPLDNNMIHPLENQIIHSLDNQLHRPLDNQMNHSIENFPTNLSPHINVNPNYAYNAHDFSFQSKFNSHATLANFPNHKREDHFPQLKPDHKHKIPDDMFSPTIVNHITNWLENE